MRAGFCAILVGVALAGCVTQARHPPRYAYYDPYPHYYTPYPYTATVRALIQASAW